MDTKKIEALLEGLENKGEIMATINAENGKDIEAIKSKYADHDSLKSTLLEANKTIESFKAMDIEAIKKSADDWKEKAETAETERTKAIEKMQFDYALDSALRSSKARNAKAVVPFLDMEGLKLNNGEIIGLNELCKEIFKASCSFLKIEYREQTAKPVPPLETTVPIEEYRKLLERTEVAEGKLTAIRELIG